MTATAIRLLDDTTGSILTDTRNNYLHGLTYNATQDRFYLCRTTTTSDAVWQYVEGDLSASGTIGGSMSASNDWSAASDDGDYLVCVYPNSTTGYYLGRLTISTETASNTIQTWSPTFLTQRATVGCTGTDSFVIFYHGPSEKIHGTDYERISVRTYVPSTDTLGSELNPAFETGVSANFVLTAAKACGYMRGNYSQDRAVFFFTEGGTARARYWDHSAATVTDWTGSITSQSALVHNYNGGTEWFFQALSNLVLRFDGWGDTTSTGETVTDARQWQVLVADHANSENYLIEVNSTSSVRRKKRNSSGTWDSSWTSDSITLTGATAIRTDISNDGRFFTISGSDYLVRTVVTDQSSGRGLHLIKISFSTGTTHSGAGSANQANQATSSGSTALRAQSTANQANQALASASLTVLAAGSANTASDTTGNGSTAALREGQGSADSAVEASATAVVARSAVGSANSASEASGTASVMSAGTATANTASDTTGVASVGRLAAATANQAAEATATGSTPALGQGSADTAAEATATASITYQAAGSANQATDTTAAGSIAGADTGQGSANNAATATATGSVLHQAATTANTANTATGQSSIALYAAGAANQAEATSSVASVARFGAGSAAAAADVISIGSRQFGAAGTAALACQVVAQFNLFVSLYANGDGTGANVVDENDLTTNIWQSIDDDPRSPTDTDWINNTAVTGSKFIALTNLPSAFGNADVARVQARYRGAQFGSGTVTLYVQLFQSDESTSLSNEVAVSAVTSDGSFENTSELVLTGLNTSADKTVWDDALIRFRWETT